MTSAHGRTSGSFGLQALVAPLPVARFMREHWQRRALYVSADGERAEGLRAALFDFDIEAIVHAVDLSRSMVLRRPGTGEPVERCATTPEAYLARYRAGAQLYLSASELGGATEWINAVASDLDRWPADARADLFATRDGGGTAPHFDQNDSFTIQLRGRKRWTFAETPQCRAPLHNSADRYPVCYAPARFVRNAEVGGRTSVLMRPGDMLYLPRGCVHQTQADGESLSFNLNVAASPWSDLVLNALRDQLMRSEGWRRSASSDVALAGQRLESLRDVVSAMTPEDIAPVSPNAVPRSSPPIRASTVLRRCPTAWWSCREGEDEAVALTIHCATQPDAQCVASDAFLTILERLPGDAAPFTAGSLLDEWDYDEGAALDFIRQLVGARLVSVEAEQPMDL